MSDEKPLGLGLIGCGSFGLFCLEAFATMPEVRISAVADSRASAAETAGRRFDAAVHTDWRELLAREDVDIAHIATPPSSHHELVLAALHAGKHVLCEKPLAMNTAQADEMLAAAERAGRIAPVNFVMRHNAVASAAGQIISSRALGKPLAGRLTNCAFDTYMPPEHWFWDHSVSGGIFVEHGVHFFDLHSQWLGPASVLSAHTEKREGSGVEDRVTCRLHHEGGAVVSHYHGFDQIEPMDRADHRIICELGEVRVFGWIPMRLEVEAAVNDETQQRIEQCCDGCEVETLRDLSGEPDGLVGRGKQRDVTRIIRLTWQPFDDKGATYAESIRTLLADQIAFIRDPSHQREVTERHGRDALALAQQASQMAADG
ncbi:MAG: Gfo/Idh/MocA family protein [Phycisphaerae bacterium]